MEDAPAVPRNVLLPSDLASPDENRPPPSPLSGGYLLVLVSEPQTDAHKSIILQKLVKAFLSWDVEASGIDIERELAIVTALYSEGDFAKNGERLIQNASEHLITEILINPQINTMRQCIRNLLCSFTKYRFVIHAGYSFAGNGSWILQDGTFSAPDFIDIFHDNEVQRVIKAYENTVRIDICCIAEGSWNQSRINQEPFSKICQIEINPRDKISPGNVAVREFVDYLEKFIVPLTIDELLEPSDIVGNIRFSHPTLYVFPGGEGDAALFGINGFNMLIDGGFNRKACFWNFVRHLDRLDAVLLTRFNNSNVGGMSGIVQRKVSSYVYPQIGHFFSNLQMKRNLPSPDGDKDKEPLLVDLIEEGHRMVLNLKRLELKPHHCYRDSNCEPINLYHKVGHGKLDMYVISPAKDSREVKEFLLRWNNHDVKLFSGTTKSGNRELRLPVHNLVSICALLVWQPAKPDENVTRILFPGSTPQHKIFEGLEKMRHLEFLKHSTCTMKSITAVPVSSYKAVKAKITTSDKIITDELTKADAKLALAAENEVNATPKTVPEVKKVKRRPVEKTEKVEKAVKDKDVTNNTKGGVQKSEKERDESPTPTKVDDKKKVEPKKITKPMTERKTRPPSSLHTIDKKSESEKSSPTSPKKVAVPKLPADTTTKEVTKSVSRMTARTRTPPKVPAAAAKSIKDENNRKVAEAKQQPRTRTPPKTTVPTKPVHKKEEEIVAAKVEKKPAPIKRPKLPAKTSAPASALPAGVKKPASLKSGKADDVKRILKKEAEKTDSSAVSTPSTVDADAVLPVTKDVLESVTTVDEKKMPSSPPMSTAVVDDRNVSTYVSSIIRKEGQDGEEDDEILIIETTEIKPINYEEQKYLRDEKESEKDKISPTEEIQNQLIAKSKAEFDRGKLRLETEKEMKAADLKKSPTLLTPDEKVKLEGEVDGIISTATEMVGTTATAADQKTEQHIQENKAKVEVSNELMAQEKAAVHASDEKLSAFESSSTTAPTMPEDETVNDIKYEVEEKYDKEETKEKSSGVSPEEKIVEKKLDQFEDEKRFKRDAVKTPDEVADLPIYEEAETVDRSLSNEEKQRRPSKIETTVEQPTTEVVQPEHAEFVTITPTPASTPDEKALQDLLSSENLKSKSAQERKASVTVSDVEKIEPEEKLSPVEKDSKISSKESIDLQRKESLRTSTSEGKPDVKAFIGKDLTTSQEKVSTVELLLEEKSKLSPETIDLQKKSSPGEKSTSLPEHSPLQDSTKSPELHEEVKISDISHEDLPTITSVEKSKLEKKDSLATDLKDLQRNASVSDEKPTAGISDSSPKDAEQISHIPSAEPDFAAEKEISSTIDMTLKHFPSSETQDISSERKLSMPRPSIEAEVCHNKKDSITDGISVSSAQRKLSIKEYLDETSQEKLSTKEGEAGVQEHRKDSIIDGTSVSSLQRDLAIKECLDKTLPKKSSPEEEKAELHRQKKDSITDEGLIANLQRKLSLKEYLDETEQETELSLEGKAELHQKEDSMTDEASISHTQRKLSLKEYLDETQQKSESTEEGKAESHQRKKDSISDETSISNQQRELSLKKYLDETQLEIASFTADKAELSQRKDSLIETSNLQRKLSLKEYLDETEQQMSPKESKAEVGHEKKDSLTDETSAAGIQRKQSLKEYSDETQLKSPSPKQDVLKADSSLSFEKSSFENATQESKKYLQHAEEEASSNLNRRVSITEYLKEELSTKDSTCKDSTVTSDSENHASLESSPHEQQLSGSSPKEDATLDSQEAESLSKVSPDEKLRPFLKESNRKLSITVSSPEGKLILDSMELSEDTNIVTEAKDTQSAPQSPAEKSSPTKEMSRRDSKDFPSQFAKTTEQKLTSAGSAEEKLDHKIETDTSDLLSTSVGKKLTPETDISTLAFDRKMSLNEYLEENEISSVATGADAGIEKDSQKRTTPTEISEKTSPVLSHTLAESSAKIAAAEASASQSSATEVLTDSQKEISAKQDSKEYSPSRDTDGGDASIKATAESVPKEPLRKDSVTKISPEGTNLLTDVNLEKRSPVSDSKISPERKDSLTTPPADKKQTDSIETSSVDDKSTDSRKSSLKFSPDGSNLASDEPGKTGAEKDIVATTELSTQEKADLMKGTFITKSPTEDSRDYTSDSKLLPKEMSELKLEKFDHETNVAKVSPKNVDLNSSMQETTSRKSSTTKFSQEIEEGDEKKPSAVAEKFPDKSLTEDLRKSSLAQDSKIELKSFLHEGLKSSPEDKKFEPTELSTTDSFDDRKKDLLSESPPQEKQTESIDSPLYDSKIGPDTKTISTPKTSPQKHEDLVTDTSTVEITSSSLRKDSLIKYASEEKPSDTEKPESISIRKDSIAKVSPILDSSLSPEALRRDSVTPFSPDKQEDSTQPLIGKEKTENAFPKEESVTKISPTLDSSVGADVHSKDSLEKTSPQENKTDSIAAEERTSTEPSRKDSISKSSSDFGSHIGTIRKDSLLTSSFEEKSTDSTQEILKGDAQSPADPLRKDSITKSSFTTDSVADGVKKESLSKVSPEEKFKDLPEQPVAGETKFDGHLRRDSIVTSAIYDSSIVGDEPRKGSLVTPSSEEIDLHSSNVQMDSFRKDSLKISPDEKKIDSVKLSPSTDSVKLSTTETELLTKHTTTDDTKVSSDFSRKDSLTKTSAAIDSISSTDTTKDSLKTSLTEAVVDSATKPSAHDILEKKIDRKDSIGKTFPTADSHSSVPRKDSLRPSLTETTDSIRTESDDMILEKETTKNDFTVKTSTVDSSSSIDTSRKDSLKSSPAEVITDLTRKSSTEEASGKEILRKDTTAKTSTGVESDSSPDALRKDLQKSSPTEMKTDAARKFSIDDTTSEKETVRKDSVAEVFSTVERSLSQDASLKSSPTEMNIDSIRKSSTDDTSEKETLRKVSTSKTSPTVDSSYSPDALKGDSFKSSPTEVKADATRKFSTDGSLETRRESTLKTSPTTGSSFSPDDLRKDSIKSSPAEKETDANVRSSIDILSGKETLRKDSIEKTLAIDSSSSPHSQEKSSLKSSPTEATIEVKKFSLDDKISEKESTKKHPIAETLDVDSSASPDVLKKDSPKSPPAEVKTESIKMPSIDNTIVKDAARKDSLIEMSVAVDSSSSPGASGKDSSKSSPTEIKTDSVCKSSKDDTVPEKETITKEHSRKDSIVALGEKVSSTIHGFLSHVPGSADTSRRTSITKSLTGEREDSKRDSLIELSLDEMAQSTKSFGDVKEPQLSPKEIDDSADRIISSPSKLPSEETTTAKPHEYVKDSIMKSTAEEKLSDITKISPSESSRKDSVTNISSDSNLADSKKSSPDRDVKEDAELTKKALDETLTASTSLISDISRKESRQITSPETDPTAHTHYDASAEKMFRKDSTTKKDSITASILEETEKFIQKYSTTEDSEIILAQRKDSLIRSPSATDESHSEGMRKASLIKDPTPETLSETKYAPIDDKLDSPKQFVSFSPEEKKAIEDSKTSCDLLLDCAAQPPKEQKYSPVEGEEDAKSLKRASISKSIEKKDEESRKRSSISDLETNIPVKRGSLSKSSPEADTKEYSDQKIGAESSENLTSVISFAESQIAIEKSPKKSDDLRKDSLSFDAKFSPTSFPPETVSKDSKPESSAKFEDSAAAKTETFHDTLEPKILPSVIDKREIKEKTDTSPIDSSKISQSHDRKSTDRSEEIKLKSEMTFTRITSTGDVETAAKVSPGSDTSESDRFSKSDSISVCTEKLISDEEQTRSDLEKKISTDSKRDTRPTSDKFGISDDAEACKEMKSTTLSTKITVESTYETKKELSTENVRETPSSVTSSRDAATTEILKSEKEISSTEVADEKTDLKMREKQDLSAQGDAKLIRGSLETETTTQDEFLKESSRTYDAKSELETNLQYQKGMKTEDAKTYDQEKFLTEKFMEAESKSNEFSTLSFETADSIKVQKEQRSDEQSKTISSKTSITTESSALTTKFESEAAATGFKSSKPSSPEIRKESDRKGSIHECSDEFYDAESSKITFTELGEKNITRSEDETKDLKISEGMSERDMVASMYFETGTIRKPSVECTKTESKRVISDLCTSKEDVSQIKSTAETEKSSPTKSDQIDGSHKIYSETVTKTSRYEDAIDTVDVDDKTKSSKTTTKTVTSSTVTTELAPCSTHTKSTVQSEDVGLKDTKLIKMDERHVTSTMTSSELSDSEFSHQYAAIEKSVDQEKLEDDADVSARKHSTVLETEKIKQVPKSSDVTEIASVKQEGPISEGKAESQIKMLHKPAGKCTSEPLRSAEKIYHEEKATDKLEKQTSCPEGDDTAHSSNDEVKPKDFEKIESTSSSWRSPGNIVTSIFSSVVSTAGDLKEQVLSTTLGKSGKSSTSTSDKTETATTENTESITEKLSTLEKHIAEKAKMMGTSSDAATDGLKPPSAEEAKKEDKQQTPETKSYSAATEVSSKDEISKTVTVVETTTKPGPHSSSTISTFSSKSPTGADRSGKVGSFAERGHQLTSPELHLDASQLCVKFTSDKKDDEEAKRFALKCKSNSEEFYDVASADTVADLNLKFEKKEPVSKTISLPILDEKFEDSSKTSADAEKGDDFSRSYPYLEKISGSESRTPTNLSDPSLNKQMERELQSKSVSLPVIKRPDDSEKYMTLPHLYKTTNLEDLTSKAETIAHSHVKQQAIKETDDEDLEQRLRTVRRVTVPDDEDFHESVSTQPGHVICRTVTEVTRKTSSGGPSETGLEHDIVADDGSDNERPLSPRSDASTGQLSRGRQDSQLYESDDEMIESTFSASSNIGHFKEDDDIQSQLASLQKEASRRISASMTQSFYGSFPSSEDEDEREKKSEIKSDASSSKTAKDDVNAVAASTAKTDENKEKEDPIRDWGSPMRLPEPRRNGGFLVWNPFREWGRPLGLPSPGPQRKDSNGDIEINLTPINAKGTPKRTAKKTTDKNGTVTDSSKQREVSNKKSKNTKTVVPLYVDLAYVPHHGNPYYTTVEFFKRIRARYYVFSGTDPSKDVFNALLEGKRSWENQDLEVTIISTYDTDVLGFWITENEGTLADLKIDLAPSASRCTINLQDHDTSCSAYRLEF